MNVTQLIQKKSLNVKCYKLTMLLAFILLSTSSVDRGGGVLF